MPTCNRVIWSGKRGHLLMAAVVERDVLCTYTVRQEQHIGDAEIARGLVVMTAVGLGCV